MSLTLAPVHPCPRPADGTDSRFSPRLAIRIGGVLTRHGFPLLTTSADLIHLQQAPFRLIYQQKRRQRPTT